MSFTNTQKVNEGEKMNKKILLSFIVFITLIPSVFSLACVGISQGADWNGVVIEIDGESYFSPRVYNTTSVEDAECDDAWYHIELDFLYLDEEVSDYFDYEFDNERFYLRGGETKQVMLKLKPKVDYGNYTVKITAVREAGHSTMMSYVFTSSAKLTVFIGEETTGTYDEIPFWKERKDCEGGFVVREGEICPKLCPNGEIILETEECPITEPQKPVLAVALEDEESFSEEILVGAGIAVLFVVGLIGYNFYGKRRDPTHVIH